jgi:hypothetical protein
LLPAQVNNPRDGGTLISENAVLEFSPIAENSYATRRN